MKMRKCFAVFLLILVPVVMRGEIVTLYINIVFDYSEIRGSNAVPDDDNFRVQDLGQGQQIKSWDSRAMGYAKPSIASLNSNTTAANVWWYETNLVDEAIVNLTNGVGIYRTTNTFAEAKFKADIDLGIRASGVSNVVTHLDRIKFYLRQR